MFMRRDCAEDAARDLPRGSRRGASSPLRLATFEERAQPSWPSSLTRMPAMRSTSSRASATGRPSISRTRRFAAFTACGPPRRSRRVEVDSRRASPLLDGLTRPTRTRAPNRNGCRREERVACRSRSGARRTATRPRAGCRAAPREARPLVEATAMSATGQTAPPRWPRPAPARAALAALEPAEHLRQARDRDVSESENRPCRASVEVRAGAEGVARAEDDRARCGVDSPQDAPSCADEIGVERVAPSGREGDPGDSAVVDIEPDNVGQVGTIEKRAGRGF